ncbi:hypothetical protein CEY00_Acc29632 [Actinidia chinensis var. chinensis]|uniref:Uncharacterized protein n=1 Tax=Actinidia chinensis var. chinensis TaxID=1590841 RepID=A0A2R6PDF5_ACTCC|nr:hypothetical protein CEY00_Acc29632 [Actinidia chinensis var. chinensis]
MGCGVSRLNAEGEAIPAKFRPIFRRRIEEIRRRRCSSGAMKDTAGKELLLNSKAANEEIDNNARISASSSPEDSIASCVTSEGSKRPEKSVKTEKKANEKEKEGAKGAAKAEEGGNVDNENEGDSEEEDERMIEASINFPGSPSFRIYFKGNSGDDEDNNDGGKKDQANDRTRNREHGTSPKEDSVPEKAKKGRKRSLKKAVSKRGHNAVKNLLNVRSCYTPSGSSHDRAHLLPGKPSA